MGPETSCNLPGSSGEHDLQDRLGTSRRAAAFYNKQMLDHLNPLMREYLAKQEMAFISTADGHGECDCSFRAGPPGFIRALDERTLIYPELRGNGVMASMGNLAENPHIGLLFLDFYESTIGLHVNGRARVVDDEAVQAFGPFFERLDPALFELPEGAKSAEQWVVVHVEEAYIHCSKHIPLMSKLDKDIHWATDDNVRKGGDFFRAKHSPRPWVPSEPVAAADSAEATAPAEPADAPVAVEPQIAASPVAEPTVAETSGLALVEVAATRALDEAPAATGAEEPAVEDVTVVVEPAQDPAPAAVAESPAVVEAAATTEAPPLPDWAFEYAAMSDIDWAKVADIARRIGEIQPSVADGADQTD